MIRQLVFLLILSVLISACGSNQSSTKKTKTGMVEPVKTDSALITPANELGMWKVASYAGNLGDNKNSNYITNGSTVWGSYSNSTADHAELKVKFLIDKVSFCIKLYEYGTKIVRKGDESDYQITVRQEGSQPLVFAAINVSDRIFIPEADARLIIEMFNKGERMSFTLVNDSKSNPSTYDFFFDRPGGFSDALKKLTK
ncbi:MAG: hypothetical protein WCP08_14755 [Prolixibacteraceae bacterium]